MGIITVLAIITIVANTIGLPFNLYGHKRRADAILNLLFIAGSASIWTAQWFANNYACSIVLLSIICLASVALTYDAFMLEEN